MEFDPGYSAMHDRVRDMNRCARHYTFSIPFTGISSWLYSGLGAIAPQLVSSFHKGILIHILLFIQCL